MRVPLKSLEAVLGTRSKTDSCGACLHSSDSYKEDA